MKRVKKNTIFILLIAGFLISSIFGCALAVRSSFMMHDKHSTHVSACCDINSIIGSVTIQRTKGGLVLVLF